MSVDKKQRKPVKGLIERLRDGENVLIAEGYLLEFERRGYVSAAAYIPEVVLEHPEVVRQLHYDFVHAGTDVLPAYTYYGHREKMRVAGREGDLERLNRDALRIAREVADDTGTLMAGDLSNTNLYTFPPDPAMIVEIKDMFKEQVEWAVEEKADFIILETTGYVGEALLGLEAIKKYGKGLPAVVTLAAYKDHETLDHVPFPQALRKLEDAGADVVGFNCARGPFTMLPLIKEALKVCKGPIAAVPVTLRTTPEEPTMQTLTLENGDKAWPTDLDRCLNSRAEIIEFSKQCKELGLQYVGLCCGNSPHYFRELVQVYGRSPPASRWGLDLSKSAWLGKDPKVKAPVEAVFRT